MCKRCQVWMSIDVGMDPTDYCNDCVWEVLDATQDAIRKHLPALKKMAAQVVHPKNNAFSRMVKDFEKALDKHEALDDL